MEVYRERDAMGRERMVERETVYCSIRGCGREAVRVLTGGPDGTWYAFCPVHAAEQWGCIVGAKDPDNELVKIYEEELEERRR